MKILRILALCPVWLIFLNLAVAVENGSLISPNDPIAKSMVYVSTRGSACSGTLVANADKTKTYVLTAAHCVLYEGTLELRRNFEILFGIHPKNPEHMRKVSKVKLHPKEKLSESFILARRGYVTHDIALLEIEGDLPPGFIPAQIESLDHLGDHEIQIAGYGGPIALARQGTLQLDERSIRKTFIFGRCFYSALHGIQKSEGAAIEAGDSGGPIFYVDDEGIVKIVAISSSRPTEFLIKINAGLFYRAGDSYCTSIFDNWEWIQDILEIPRHPVKT